MKNEPILKKEDLLDSYSIIHNFDLSVVIPFYKKLNEFVRVLPLNAPFFQRNGIEVVISMDEDSQQIGLLDLIKSYPFINWRVIVNHQKHDWRNPVKAINVGIKHSSKKFIMVCSPESEFQTDAIYQLRKALEDYNQHFVIGSVAFALEDDQSQSNWYRYVPYGSIMVKSEDIHEIGGYDESLILWGGDDDNIRARLEMSGVRKLFLPEVKLLHREKDKDGMEKRREKRLSIPIKDELDIYFPNKFEVNKNGWGLDYADVVYDWKFNSYAEEIVVKFLNQFETYKISDENAFCRKYKKILLAQSHNEQEIILDFLENMSLYFDGIILLDDGSTDNTYQLAENPKLILKVKKNRIGFIDIENRNILLDLVSFFSTEWICFMDTDEKFDERFSDFNEVTSSKDVDVIIFRNINLWNSEETYNAEYPYSLEGIMHKKRMFRNIGHSQILTNKAKFHFDVVPYHTNAKISTILYKHFGMLYHNMRLKKYQFYSKEDKAKDQQSYEHLIIENPSLLNVNNIFRSKDGLRNSKAVSVVSKKSL